MSARTDNVVTFPIVPRLRVSGDHPPKAGRSSAIVVILPMIKIEHCPPDDTPVRKRRPRRRQSISIK